MPEISGFSGMTVKMFFRLKEHEPSQIRRMGYKF